MSGKRVFLYVQALLCILAAGLLAAAALSLYAEGAAKQAEGDLFHYIYTREKAGAKLQPILPLLFCSLGVTVFGLIMGIRDERADQPMRDEKLLRDFGLFQEKATRRQGDRTAWILRAAALAIAVILILLGILNGGMEDVLAKGAAICTECVGLG